MTHWTKVTLPACGSPRVIPVTRDATPGPEFVGSEQGKWEVLLTIYPVGEDDPDWRCGACDYEWIDPTITPPV